MTSDTTQRKSTVDAIIAAWQALYPNEERKRRGDAGARAQLRRAATPADVELEPAFHEFLKRMKETGFDFEPYRNAPHRLRRIALIAGLLAGRKTDRIHGTSVMRALGKQQEMSDALFKPLRFQALIGALDRGDEAEIMTSLRRALQLAKEKDINLKALVKDLLSWGEEARRRWTYDYFGHPYDSSSTENNAISTEETAA